MKAQPYFKIFLFILAAALPFVVGIDNNHNTRKSEESSSQDEDPYVEAVRGQRMRRAASKGSKSSKSSSGSSPSGSGGRTHYDLQRCQGDCDNDRDVSSTWHSVHQFNVVFLFLRKSPFLFRSVRPWPCLLPAGSLHSCPRVCWRRA
jgi:hypothetical protein